MEKKNNSLPDWPAHGSAWPSFEIAEEDRKKIFEAGWHDPEPEPDKWCNSVTEAIFRELHRRYKLWRHPPMDIESEIAAALANEIAAEIDKEILEEIYKATGIPKDKL